MATKKSTPAKSSPAKSAAKLPAVKKTASPSTRKTSKGAENTVEAPASSKSPATHQEIADLAHKYFAERGGAHGSHVADWLRAEKELNS